MIFKAEIEFTAEDIVLLGSKVKDVINFLEGMHEKSRYATWELKEGSTSKCSKCGHIAETEQQRTLFCPDCGSVMKNYHSPFSV